MYEAQTSQPIKTAFLDRFSFSRTSLHFSDKEITKLDQQLEQYETSYLNPAIEQNLVSKNEFLTSFAISKAENSTLTIKEATAVYNTVISLSEFDFLGNKIKSGKSLTQKDYEKLEFYNIAKTFKSFNRQSFQLKDLTPKMIKSLHRSLTQGMDLFKEYLPQLTVYRSGYWRNNNEIFVDTYQPAPHRVISQGVTWLTQWLKKNPSITNIGVFHTCLYALHPFNNGNKRTCRILEHILLRSIGLNKKNLYSTSYYYHKEKSRYLKYLLYSLSRKNLNHFTNLVQEAIVISIIEVLKTSIEVQRSFFLKRQLLDKKVLYAIKPLIKRRDMQYKLLWKKAKYKMSNKTFVTYLAQAVDDEVVLRRGEGRRTFYSLNLDLPEDMLIKDWVSNINRKLPYMPEKYLLV